MMDVLEVLLSHGVEVGHIDGVPPTWSDVVDRLVVDLKDLGWHGRLHSIAARDGSLEVELDGDATPAMLARVDRAADEARHVCEDCGAAANGDRQGRALCARCTTLVSAVGAALEAAPDDATLGSLVYELYCAWELRRSVADFDEDRERSMLRAYSSDEVFEELRRWTVEGPPLAATEPPVTRTPADWEAFVEALEASEGQAPCRARLRREHAWHSALAAATRSVTLAGVSWETCRALREEAKTARITFRDQTLEIREPGAAHAIAAAALAEAVATAARECELSVEVVMAPAHVSEDLHVVAAPDLAVVDPATSRPAELAIDVAFDASAAWRVEAYRLLGVPEVWHFGADAVEILVLDGGTYVAAKASALFPRLRHLTLRHIAETAVRSDLVAARRYTERVLDER